MEPKQKQYPAVNVTGDRSKNPYIYVMHLKQNNRILKEEHPRLVGAQYATGDPRRNNSRKNEDNRVKAKTTLSCTLAGDVSKINAVKSNTA